MQGRTLFLEHLLHLPLSGAVNTCGCPAFIPVEQKGVVLLNALEGFPFQWRALRMADRRFHLSFQIRCVRTACVAGGVIPRLFGDVKRRVAETRRPPLAVGGRCGRERLTGQAHRNYFTSLRERRLLWLRSARSVDSRSRYDFPSIEMISERWMSRSTSETTHAALGKTSFHCANCLFVVTMVLLLS